MIRSMPPTSQLKPNVIDVFLRWITAGETRDGRVEVLTGLKAGERTVLSPPPALEDGGRIEVK